MSNIIYSIIQQIQSDNWYHVSNEMNIAKGKNKLGYHYIIKRGIFKFLNKNKHL